MDTNPEFDDRHFGQAYERLRADLMHRLGDVDVQILVSIVSSRTDRPLRPLPTDFFSDWPDTYNRQVWYKTWGKGGGIAEVPPEAELPLEAE